ncbi:MAG: non-ribosomal peptide synthetase [Chloroflexi bacterium]|nr:non-ribosomal peptide synthetase [Chloroflexota bacterium]
MTIEIQVDGTIPAQFAIVSALLPEQAAVLLDGETITYGQLAQQSRLVTNFFVNELGDIQTPIPVLHTSQTRMIPLLVGIVNAGHMYSAISSQEPAARIVSILKDLGAPLLVVCEPELLALAREVCLPEIKIILASDASSETETLTRVNLGPESCAAITFTSGSTGEPKGIVRTHKMILHLANTYQEQFDFGPDTRMLAIRPYSASASFNELFTPLITGASIVPFDLRENGLGQLAQVLRQQKVTIMHPTVQVLRTFLDTLAPGANFPDIRYFFATGDILYRTDVEKMRQVIPVSAVIVHQIAMSETGLLAVNKILSDTVLDSDVIPAGFPVKGKEVLILDEGGSILQAGEVGEIHVRSRFSFPGYWRAEGKTSERFVPDPLDTSKKIFATGDLGRLRPDGQLEHIGRKDWRVKIRGFSVDLAAIEHVLMSSSKIHQAIVIPGTASDGQKKLVAYIQPAVGETLVEQELRILILARLPSYMLPALFMMIYQVPLTSSGKVDRKALPAPDWNQAQSTSEYAPAQDAVETKLVEIWQKVFAIQKIGTQDDYFELGGDSLLASVLFLEIERVFGQSFPLSILLKHPTISSLAGLLRKESSASDLEDLVALRAAGSKPPLFLAPGSGGDTITFLELANALNMDQPVYGLEDFHIGTPESIYANGIGAAAVEFIRAIKKVQPEGPYYLGGHSFGGVQAFEIACQLEQAGEEVGLLMVFDAAVPKKITRHKKLDKRLKTYFANLKQKSFKEKILYILERIKWRFKLLSKSKWVQKIYKLKIIQDRLWFDRHRYPFMARTEYQPGKFNGDLVVYRSTEKPLYKTWDITEAWPEFVTGRVTYYDVPGNHLTMLRQPYVAQLAALVTEHLGQAFERSEPQK